MKNWYRIYGEDTHNKDQQVVVDKDTGNTIAVTYNDANGRNARLMSAAPNMLAVLQETLSNMYDTGFSEYETKPLQDAINKATGGEA